MNNIMLDLETMGVQSDAAIVAIGAVRFDLETGEIGESWYSAVKLESSLVVGLTVTASTVEWWMKQSDKARSVLWDERALTLPSALHLFSGWAVETGTIDGVWGNGASFDNSIINTAYRACGHSKPWRKNQDKCYSTIRSLYPLKLEFEGIAHNAVDDAKHQAKVLIAINKQYDLKIK